MKSRGISTGLNYGRLFEGWEIAIAKALVGEFCGDEKTFPLDDFDDLLQDVLTHWFSRRDRYDASRRASRRTFMRRVVRNKLNDLKAVMEADKRRTLGDAESLESPQGEGEDALALGETVRAADIRSARQIELKAHLSLALEDLTDRERAILELKRTGLSHEEIGETLGVCRDTVQGDICRIRRLFESRGLRKYYE